MWWRTSGINKYGFLELFGSVRPYERDFGGTYQEHSIMFGVININLETVNKNWKQIFSGNFGFPVTKLEQIENFAKSIKDKRKKR